MRSVGVHADEGTHRPAAADRDHRGQLPLAEDLAQERWSALAATLAWPRLLRLEDVEEAVERQAVSLVIAGPRALREEIRGIVRLLVEVRRVVPGAAQGVRHRPGHVLREAAVA